MWKKDMVAWWMLNVKDVWFLSLNAIVFFCNNRLLAKAYLAVNGDSHDY